MKMPPETPNLASTDKILYHQERLWEYRGGEIIYPVEFELYPENHCNASCPWCPAPGRVMNASMDFWELKQILDDVAGKTKGLYVSWGGEPTLHPNFVDILSCARDNGFQNVVMITNGQWLTNPIIQRAILKYADSVRVSLNASHAEWHSKIYWTKDKDFFERVLLGIKQLTEKRNAENSKTEIGIATLTNKWTAKDIIPFYELACRLGVDWVHFRPWVNGWKQLWTLAVKDSDEVTQALEKLPKNTKPKVIISENRYATKSEDMRFSEYHYGHFVTVLTADGHAHASDELSDFPQYSLGKPREFRHFEDFLHNTGRLEKLRNINHTNHPRLGWRTRWPLYSHRIEQILKLGDLSRNEHVRGITHPFIL